jgi:hypothetical protein
MQYAFAVEPALLGKWSDFRYLHEKFGVHETRMIAKFPKKWQRMVLDAASDFTEMQRKSLVKWLQRRDDLLVACERDFDMPDDWLHSAELADAKNGQEFQAILACQNPRKHPKVIPSRDEIIGEHPLFFCPRGLIKKFFFDVGQKRDISGIFAMLKDQHIKEMIIIDPFCGTGINHKNNTVQLCLYILQISEVINNIKIICKEVSYKDKNYEDPTTLKTTFEKILKKNGLSAEVTVVSHDKASSMHDRTIATTIITQDGRIKKICYDLSGGIANLYNTTKATKVFLYQE